MLVVEDDDLIASSLARALRARGHLPLTASTLAEADEVLTRHRPGLVLLDLGLPDGDGAELAARIARQLPTVPVIVLTARAEESDVVQGLEAGAVDYVIKPFRLAELLARIDAHLRQADAWKADGGPIDGRLALDDLEIHTAARRVTVGGGEVALRPREYDLLVRLAIDAGAVVTREQLIDDVWDENWWGSTHTLDVHINALRRKLGPGQNRPDRITTIRGVGYRLEAGR